MASGIRDFSVTFGSRIVGLAAGIGIASCLAWNLGPEGRGSYAVAMLLLTILSVVFMVGCDVASRYFVASKKWSVSKGIVNIFILGGACSAVAIVVGLIITKLPLPFVSKASVWAFRLALLGIPITVFAATFLRMLAAVQEFEWFAIISIVRVVSHLLFVLTFVWFFSWGVEGALLALLVSSTLVISLSLMFFRLRYDLRWVRPELSNLREMFFFGARYYVGKISNEVNFRVGTLILAFFASESEIGLFAVAASFASQVMIVPNALINVLFPRVAADDTGRRELVAQCARVTGVICGGLLLTLAVFAEPIVALLFSPKFLPTVPLVRIIAVGLFLYCACKVFGPYLVGTNHPGLESTAVMAGMVSNLLLLWVLLPQLGLIGAAISMSVGYFVSSMILAISFNRLSQVGPMETWRLRRSDWKALGQIGKKVLQ